MLVDKFDSQIQETLLSPRAIYSDKQQNNQNVTRFPKIPTHITHQSHSSLNTVLTPKHSRQSIGQHPFERQSQHQEESMMNRGPKVYGKNLPDVFIPNTPGAKRIKKLIAGIKENSRTESSVEKITNQSRPTISQQQSRNVNAFISPVRLIQIKNPAKRHPLYHNDSGNLSTIESITSRNNVLTTEPTAGHGQSHSYLPGRASVSPKNCFVTPFPNSSNQIVNAVDRLSFNNIIPSSAHQKERQATDEVTKQIKKLIVFKKMISSKSPDKNNITRDETKVKVIPKDQIPGQVLQLNELITLKKIKTTQSKGVLKRMLHAPSFRIFDIQEEPISELKSKETLYLKDWLSLWKNNFAKSKYLTRIYSCFWNSPEGCVSILMEPARDGFLNDLVANNGSLPESCLQTVAKDILNGIIEIHEKTNRCHGSISSNEIMLTNTGHVKLSPGISQVSMSSSLQPIKFASDESSSALKSKRIQSSEISHRSSISNLAGPNFSQDIFDFGLTLLQCAMGDMSLFDTSATLTPENIKLALDSITAKKHYKTSCCILHSEDVIKKALGFISSSNSNSGSQSKKRILTNNFSIKSPRPFSSRNTNASIQNNFGLISMLALGDRFSETFIDFLCCCLKLDPSQRCEPKDLLNHEFLSENHQSLGPLISMSELIKVQLKDGSSLKKYAENLNHKHLDKFVEALKVVFLNKEVKQKFDLIQSKSGRTQIEEKRVVELSKELDVSQKTLSMKLKDCFTDDDD